MSTREQEAQMDDLIGDAQRLANSWTLSLMDARWVATEAARRMSTPDDAVWHELHTELQGRVGYWPSAREVAAICRAVRCAEAVPHAD